MSCKRAFLWTFLEVRQVRSNWKGRGQNLWNFVSLQAAIKSFPFAEPRIFHSSWYFILLFLSPTAIRQYLPFVVINNRWYGFRRAKLSRSRTKPSSYYNVQIVIKSQPDMALVWKLLFWLFETSSYQFWIEIHLALLFRIKELSFVQPLQKACSIG